MDKLHKLNITPLRNEYPRVAAVDHNEVGRLLSLIGGKDGVVVLAVTYPKEDSRNHRSQYALVSQLTQHGMADTGALIEAEKPYLLFEDKSKALRVYDEILKDSAAIGVIMSYHGHVGVAAVHALEAELKGGAA